MARKERVSKLKREYNKLLNQYSLTEEITGTTFMNKYKEIFGTEIPTLNPFNSAMAFLKNKVKEGFLFSQKTGNGYIFSKVKVTTAIPNENTLFPTEFDIVNQKLDLIIKHLGVT